MQDALFYRLVAQKGGICGKAPTRGPVIKLEAFPEINSIRPFELRVSGYWAVLLLEKTAN